jgi:benzoate-CoA ligase family protein
MAAVKTLPERYNASLLLDANLAAGRGEKTAIICGEERISYAALLERVCRLGNALRALGMDREQRVLLCLDDTPAFPVAFFGAIRAGIVPVPFNPLFKPDDYRYFLEDSDARAIVIEPAHLPKLMEALDGYLEPVMVIVTGSDAPAGAFALEELLAAQSGELQPAPTHRDDIAFWLYSSGSTGRPKGVVHLQRDIPYTCETYARDVVGFNEDDVVFGRVCYHAYGLGNCLTFPFSAGATTILSPDRPTPRGLLETAQRLRPTLLALVPTLYNAILNDPASAGYDLASIRLCLSAAEPLPPETWRRWHERFGLTILDGIGSTELLHIFCSNAPDALRPGSSGKPVQGYDLELRDENGALVAAGEVGDLYVRGGSCAPFYWRKREKSVQTFRGEWAVTGDRYRRDADGFYWYEGRSDDMIKIGGEWVSPIAIENALLEHAVVGEAAVVGVPVEGVLRIKAVIMLGDGAAASPELVGELQEWCKGRLQRYQYPHLVEFTADLPKTMTGKIQRFKLREAVT